MSESIIDTIGQILWYSIFLTPLITFPLVWKYSKFSFRWKIAASIGYALAISIIFLFLSLGIAFRNGLGPT